jgi:hypothetical protein
MNMVAKIGMLIWTVICFVGACTGMVNVANHTNGAMSDAEAVGTGIGMFMWMLIWFLAMVGMGIVALVTNPKVEAPKTATAAPVANLCPHCGKYYSGPATFCPHCGQSQTIASR